MSTFAQAPTYRDPIVQKAGGGWAFDVQWLDWFLRMGASLGGATPSTPALHAPASTGLVVHTGGGSSIARAIVSGTSPSVIVSNGDGITGNPTIRVEGIAVGGIYVTTSNVDPALSLGYGTWEQFGQGRVLVGQDNTNPWFDSAGETGGSLT